MPVLPIVRMGDPVLRSPAGALDPARIGAPEIQRFIDDMVETMRDADGVGLAAPQVGEPAAALRLRSGGQPEDGSGRDSPHGRHQPDGRARAPGSWSTTGRDASRSPTCAAWCRAIPAVRVRGLDRHGAPLDYVARGFEARIVQHEFDHLNGVLFLDRMRDLKSLAFYDEWETHLRGDGDDPRSLKPE